MIKRLALLLILSLAFAPTVNADTLHLKNGRSLEGLIRGEDEDSVDLEISIGSIKFLKSEIDKIDRSSAEGADIIRQKWEKQKIDIKNKILNRQLEEEKKPKQVQFSQDKQNIIVNTLLNGKVEARLVLDTGASVIMLRKGLADKLGLKLDKAMPDANVTLADGRKVSAKFVNLESVKVENAEAENVAAAVLLEEEAGFDSFEGLLGMSFLKNFNFKIDHKEQRLILEKL